MIELPSVPRPSVSVVIVTYGAWEWVERTLQALLSNTEPCYEVILVDNASPDETTENLRTRVRGATLVLNDRNVGFGPGSNQGVLHARGEFVCLLNSDALVQPGWLPPLLETLESGPVGAVVPRFLNLDGTLQEAGSVVGSDGHTRSFGDGFDASRPEFNFPRVVDFGSAACLVARRSDFLAFGGFDVAYGVGYYEDVDFCFRLRESGLDTVYVPSSTVVHARAASSSLETASKRIATNRQLFLSRWRDRLTGRPRLETTSNLDARVLACRDAETADRLLVLADRLDDEGRLFRFLAEIRESWPHVRLTLLLSRAVKGDRVSSLLERGVEAVVQGGDLESWFEDRLFQLSAVLAWHAGPLLELDAVLRRTQPQALRALHLKGLPSSSIAFSRAAGALASSDVVLCDTEEGARFAEALGRDRPVFVLPEVTQIVSPAGGFARRRGLLFVGEGHSSDLDVLAWLVEDALPAFWSAEPDAALHVVGVEALPPHLAASSPRVIWHEDERDPIPYLSVARLLVGIWPARPGTMLRRALGWGLPAVTTPLAADGLSLGPLGTYVVASEPSDLTPLILSLYRNQALWEEVRDRFLTIATRDLSVEAYRRTLGEALACLGVAGLGSPVGTFRSA